MPTAILKSPLFADVDPALQDIWNFNVIGSDSLPAFSLTGTADIGDALRTSGGTKFVTALNTVDVSPDFTTFGLDLQFGAVYFIDEGAIPLGATINSVRFRIDYVAATLVYETYTFLNTAGLVATFDSGGFNSFFVPIVGLDNPQVSGAGTFRSDPMTVSPVTGLAWTLADLYASVQTSFDLGWWQFAFFTDPSLTNPEIDTSALSFNYIVLEVDYSSGASIANLDQLPLEIVYDFAMLAAMPTVCALDSGTLPAGVTLNADCTLTGTPSETGTFPIVVRATGAGWPLLVPMDVPAVEGVPLDLPVPTTPGSPTTPGRGGGGIPHGPGECAGVAYGIGVVVSPGATAGTGDPMSTVSIDLKQFFGGATNAPPALGFLYCYAAGSSTLQDTFSNSSLATPNTNPIELDADGNPPNPIFLGPFIYKFDLRDADNVSLPGFPIDNIAGSVWPGQVLGAVTVNPIANADGLAHSLSGTINKAASGTHALFALLKLLAPTIGAGSASLTEAATFYVAGPPLGGTTKYAVHIAQGDVLITDSASKLGFYGHAVSAQQLLATGAGHTVDDVITALQTLGLVKQS